MKTKGNWTMELDIYLMKKYHEEHLKQNTEPIGYATFRLKKTNDGNCRYATLFIVKCTTSILKHGKHNLNDSKGTTSKISVLEGITDKNAECSTFPLIPRSWTELP